MLRIVQLLTHTARSSNLHTYTRQILLFDLYFIACPLSHSHFLIPCYYTCSINLLQTASLLQQAGWRNTGSIQRGPTDLDGHLAGQEIWLTV